MIIGVGVDVVKVERFQKWVDNPRMLDRFFDSREVEVALSRGEGAAQTLAARFAAKEALGKSMGIGLMGIHLKDIRVINLESGKPEFVLTGTAQEALEKSGGRKPHLSLTHERDNAIAVVVLED